MLLFSKILLGGPMPLLLLVVLLAFDLTGNTVHALNESDGNTSSNQNLIESTCAEVGEHKWPDCRMDLSTFLLKSDNSPLVGETSCDGRCSFSRAFQCARTIANCVSPCTSSPTSTQCLTCVSNLGTCCNCLAYVVGKGNDSAGQTICNLCPAASALNNDNLLGASGVLVTKSPTLGELVLATSEGKNALVPDSDNYSPHLEAALGCAVYDISCIMKEAECSICKKVIPALLNLGSETACDAGCVGAVELVGGGPADPIADAVAAICPALCEAVYKEAAGQSGAAICKAVKLCK